MNPKGRELVTAEMVCAKYGIRDPGNMRDLQAIMGDAVVSGVVIRYCDSRRSSRSRSSRGSVSNSSSSSSSSRSSSSSSVFYSVVLYSGSTVHLCGSNNCTILLYSIICVCRFPILNPIFMPVFNTIRIIYQESKELGKRLQQQYYKNFLL